MKISDTDYLKGLLDSKKLRLEEVKIKQRISIELHRQTIEDLERDIRNLEIQLEK